jgi:hypothetical protein
MDIGQILPRLKNAIRIIPQPHGPLYVGDGSLWKFSMYPPIPTTQIAAVESRLGLRLPGLLRRVYLEVGNGHYGQFSGLCPLSVDSVPGGDPYDAAVLEVYLDFVSRPDNMVRGVWPREILPVWEWGGGTFSCLDLSDAEADDPHVVRFDNCFNEAVVPRFPYSRPERDPCFLEEGLRFSDWLTAWLDGSELEVLPYRAKRE